MIFLLTPGVSCGILFGLLGPILGAPRVGAA